jgi:hypothetical protein
MTLIQLADKIDNYDNKDLHLIYVKVGSRLYTVMRADIDWNINGAPFVIDTGIIDLENQK